MTRIPRLGLVLVSASAFILAASADLFAATAPAALFSTKCASCHTYGRGDLVGPDLKGATSRHSRSWLMSWIRSSERMIRSGDVAATSLFQRYRQQRMPDHQFSDADLAALLDYLGAGGPEADGQKALRMATSATTKDVARGRDLFFGERAMSNGGVACASCHSIQGQSALTGANFAPDLTHSYSKYQDKAMWSLLEQACFPRTPAADGRRPVTDDESFALRAYLRDTDLQGRPGRRATVSQTGSSSSR